MSLFNKDAPKSRFQVTPSADIESQFTSELLEASPSSPSTPGISDNSPTIGPYSTLGEYFTIDDGNKNTATTTSTSSNSSFYNTIYKYNKLKQNGGGGSLDTVYFPIHNRRPSNPSHAVVGIPFYNERVLVYNFLQRPTGLLAISYHIIVSVAVVYCLVLTIMSTSSNYKNSVNEWLDSIDYLIIIFFIIEFLARLWASECVSYYRGWKGKIRFFKNPIRLIDLFVIIVSLAVLVCDAGGDLLVTSLRGVRFIQIFQMVRLDFKFRPWRMMASVVYSQRIHLAIVFYMGFLALILVSFVIYFVEKGPGSQFDSLASSMWWAVITLCTIGYGDMYPKTPTGKLLACVCSLIGVSIFALPAGILGTGLALKVQEQQRQLKMSKRKQPAARLIQCAWKFYKSEQELKRLEALQNKEFCPVASRSVLFKRFEGGKNKNKVLTHKELNAVHFMFAVKLWISKRDFVRAFKPYDIKDVLEQYSAGHADMLAKVRIMDHRLEKIQASSVSPKTQHEFRLRFATHLTKLEYEIQKVQMNFNELLHYQIDSRLIIENLLKYLIDQQISLNRDLSPDEKCRLCAGANQRVNHMLASYGKMDLPTKINQTFVCQNSNILQHLRSKLTENVPDHSLPKRRRRKSF